MGLIGGMKMGTKNKNGFISLIFGVISVFAYQIIIFQILAIIFGLMGRNDAKKNPILTASWQYRLGLILGSTCLILVIAKYSGVLD